MNKGKAHVVGITGPPGAGKSTLISKICKYWAEEGLKIGVVCVDPTSPFTGGALLGDRIRMQELAKIPDIFIKSLATRGNLGGMAHSTADIVQLLDAYGKDIIVIETVGVGQVEFDVLEISDTVVLIGVPGLGDSIQTVKAGIMEIADLYVVNQADRPGADESVKDLKLMIKESGRVDWKPPVIKTIATEQEGIQRLLEEVSQHQNYLHESGLWEKKRKERNYNRLLGRLDEIVHENMENQIKSNGRIQKIVGQVKDGTYNPFSAANEIAEQIMKVEFGRK
jgi:LAO/AO transport system kinase